MKIQTKNQSFKTWEASFSDSSRPSIFDVKRINVYIYIYYYVYVYIHIIYTYI